MFLSCDRDKREFADMTTRLNKYKLSVIMTELFYSVLVTKSLRQKVKKMRENQFEAVNISNSLRTFAPKREFLQCKQLCIMESLLLPSQSVLENNILYFNNIPRCIIWWRTQNWTEALRDCQSIILRKLYVLYNKTKCLGHQSNARTKYHYNVHDK